MKVTTNANPTARDIAPARIKSAPSSGPTVRSSTTVRGAGSAPARSREGKVSGAPCVEIAADLTAAARDRLSNDRGTDHLIVQNDRERLADIRARDIGEAARADAVKCEVDDPLAGLGILPRAGIGQVRAIHLDAPAHGHLLIGIALHRQVIDTRRRWAGKIGRLIQKMERHVGGRSKQLLDAVGILHPG